MALHYLTVQDVLWINLQVTKKVEHFNYARLEEATFYQYAYGESRTLAPQAARFLSGFLRMQPFQRGNAATAFIATVTFLKINGREIDFGGADPLQWFERVQNRQTEGPAAIDEMSRNQEDEHHHGVPDIRATVKCILLQQAETINRLADSEPAIQMV
jgi:prophage maintenance system killer protein